MVTYWVKMRTAPSSARIVSRSSSSRASFPERPTSLVGSSFRYCAGWLQICLSEASSFMIRPRRAMPSDASMNAIVSRTAAS